MSKYKPSPQGCHYKFVKYVRDPRTGIIRFAKDYGKKAFRLIVKN